MSAYVAAVPATVIKDEKGMAVSVAQTFRHAGGSVVLAAPRWSARAG